MLAVVAAAFALTPAIPPEPTEPPPITWIVAGPEGTVYDTTAHFVFDSSDPGTYQCALDTTTFTLCSAEYTTPVLGLGGHTLHVRARSVGGTGPAVTRSWTIATPPAPTPVPTATPEPTPVPTQAPAEPTPAPTAVIAETRPATVLAAKPLTPIDVSLVYFMNAKQRYTRFATLSVKKVPAGATVTVTCTGGCPRKSQTLTSAKGGTVTLKAWLRKRLRTGATLTIAVTRPSMAGMTKTLTMRAQRRPRIVTKTLVAEQSR
jgi:hypothetical protein